MITELGETIVFAPKTVSGMVSVADTPATTGTDYVMQGLALVIASIISTRVWVTANGQLINNKSNGATDVVMCFGTGPPPANGDPQTGTIITSPAHFVSSLGTGAASAPFSLTAVLSEIEPKVTYWFDLAVKVSAGSAGNIVNVDVSAMGLP